MIKIILLQYELVAQLVEHRTFNPRVMGSSPTRFTNFFVFPLALRSGGFWRDDEIGRHSRLKICWVLCPWGFESPSRYYLPYGVIGNTTDFGSVIGESYSSRATLYIMYARTLLYIYLQFIKKNSIIARACGESLYPSLFTSFRCTTSLLHPPRPPKNRSKNSATFFVCKNASSPWTLC